MNLNKVLLAARLTRDPELKFLPSQMAVCNLGLACNRKWTDKNSGEAKEDTTFVDAVAFGKTAEVINQHFRKGKEIFLEGRLKYETWESKEGGKRSKLSVVIESFQFVGPKGEGGGTNVDHSTSQERPGGGGRPAAQNKPVEFADEQVADDDIPFAWEGRRGQEI